MRAITKCCVYIFVQCTLQCKLAVSNFTVYKMKYKTLSGSLMREAGFHRRVIQFYFYRMERPYVVLSSCYGESFRLGVHVPLYWSRSWWRGVIQGASQFLKHPSLHKKSSFTPSKSLALEISLCSLFESVTLSQITANKIKTTDL